MKIQSYTKQELALLYFPNATPETAQKRLYRWICRIPELKEKLLSTPNGRYSKFWTRHQVELIIYYLDEP